MHENPTPFVPAEAGTQNLAKELGPRFRGGERSVLQSASNKPLKGLAAFSVGL